jgi:hypothetical protein
VTARVRLMAVSGANSSAYVGITRAGGGTTKLDTIDVRVARTLKKDPDNPYRYLQIRGRVQRVTEGGAAEDRAGRASRA